MPSLPTVGGSSGVWGTELNTWLLVAHNADGTLKNGSAPASGLVLPTIGGSSGTWGTQLNAWLLVAHNVDGTLKNSSAPASGLVLPTVGGSSGTWGTQLNAWLLVAHNADGTLKTPVVSNLKGVGYMRWGGNQVDATHPYDLQMISPLGSPVPVVDEPVLHYFDGCLLRNFAQDGYDNGVSYEEALANNWILKDSSNNLLYNVLWGQWVADVGHPGYQAAYANNVKAKMISWGYDGIFNDDLSPNSIVGYGWNDPNNTAAGAYAINPIKYPTHADRLAAIVSFTQGIAQILRPDYLICHNAGVWGDDNGSLTKSMWTSIAPYCTHVMNEQFMHTDHPDNTNPNQIRKSGTAAWYNNAENWQGVIPHAYSLGLKPVPVTYGPSEVRLQYAFCAFMMEYNPTGGGVFLRGLVAPTYPAEFTWPTFYNNLPFGGAVGPKYMVGTEQRRDYNNGTQLRVDFTLGTSAII